MSNSLKDYGTPSNVKRCYLTSRSSAINHNLTDKLYERAQQLQVLSNSQGLNPLEKHLCYEAAKEMILAANRINDLLEDLKIVAEAD